MKVPAARSKTTFVLIPTAEAFTKLFHKPAEEPVVLFLHDPYCPISADAEDEMRATGLEVHLVDVSHQHQLSELTQHFTGVRHESPQAFILRDGKTVWHASHGRIRAKTVLEELAKPAN